MSDTKFISYKRTKSFDHLFNNMGDPSKMNGGSFKNGDITEDMIVQVEELKTVEESIRSTSSLFWGRSRDEGIDKLTEAQKLQLDIFQQQLEVENSFTPIIPPSEFTNKEFCESSKNVFQSQKSNIDLISRRIKELAKSVSVINRSNIIHSKETAAVVPPTSSFSHTPPLT